MTSSFVRRHIGPTEDQIKKMLGALGFSNLDDLTRNAVPAPIRTKSKLKIGPGASETEALSQLKAMISKNKVNKSYIGMGYYDCHTPNVILRNILENPGWYTQYTPYQAEIAQGRLEALLNFQTLITDLTGLEIANASLLDEGTAVAEAMHLAYAAVGDEKRNVFFVSDRCHPQTIEVVETRAEPLGIRLTVADHKNFSFDGTVFGAVLQYPATDGAVIDYTDTIEKIHRSGALAVVAADLLSLTLLKTPGEMNADIAVGTSQRFGVPMGFGGPHAGYFATREKFKRSVPGRIVGVSVDAQGKKAYRLALQTREQHIRREKATSNICTAQVLLAIMASMYAVYHGPEGLRSIARRVHTLTQVLAEGLASLGWSVAHAHFFDTLALVLKPGQRATLEKAALSHNINLRYQDDSLVTLSLDETTTPQDVNTLLKVFALGQPVTFNTLEKMQALSQTRLSTAFLRARPFLEHAVFNSFHSETEMLRYISRLQAKDLSLTTSMIPLGSCTMKLNATAEMIPVTWREVGSLHPFAPLDQSAGYQEMFKSLENYLKDVTGFAGVSLQPNAGSQGEYAGLLVIRKYHISRGEPHRNVCLIPTSAHGTNPASAVMAGMKVIPVSCDEHGNVDLTDLKSKATQHAQNLSALMVTYPSTHGVFEESIVEICEVVHKNGGQVYMDGANMNAQIGLCRPGEFGADVCHLNLHKTFCIPHGGGGPGMGPIGVREHLVAFLPGNKTAHVGSTTSVGAISAAPWGSASILPISWMYITMMGDDGLTRATQVAILNANYIAKKLNPFYPVLFKGREGLVAHECIVDLRGLQSETGVTVEDVAKRLIDYGYHAPTMSWPVAGTMMIEPTESESLSELDRFCDALISIHQEITAIRDGKLPRDKNMLKQAPHTAAFVTRTEWDLPYTREVAAFPSEWTKESKFWPAVARIDNAYGDRNLVCSCPPWGDENG